MILLFSFYHALQFHAGRGGFAFYYHLLKLMRAANADLMY